MAGYSAKSMWQKLGFSEEHEVVLIDAPKGFSISGAPRAVRIKRARSRGVASEAAPALIAFFVALAGMRESLPTLAKRIFPEGALWVAGGGRGRGPRGRARPHDSDVREQDIRDLALPLGLVDVKVAALDEDWSALRLVWRKERRRASPGRRG
jgi:hypothetical protein